MSDLFNEIFYMAENLQLLIEDTSDKEKQLEIFKKLEQLTQKIDSIPEKIFSGNEGPHKKVIEYIKQANQLLKKYQKIQTSHTDLLEKITLTFAEIDKILFQKAVGNRDL